MNGNFPKIEILAPFGAAFEWMKGMLFRPFDLARWLTLAFAAFIAGSWGNGINFQYRKSFGDVNYRVQRQGEVPDWTIPPWLIALIVAAILVVLLLAVLWAWVTARGRFVFTDCIVRNRAAIGEPWREYRREGNSFFLFSVLAGVASVLALIVVGVIAWVPVRRIFFDSGDDSGGAKAVLIVLGVLLLFLWLAAIIFVNLIGHFMVPVMYRRRCSAGAAFLDVTKLVVRHAGPIVLFVLFRIALAIAVAVVGTMLACMTCCIGGLPYISTALLLPAIVWLAAYRLLFLRQFGDGYDAWGGTAAPVAQLQELPPNQ